MDRFRVKILVLCFKNSFYQPLTVKENLQLAQYIKKIDKTRIVFIRKFRNWDKANKKPV